ncbi:TPA: gas vesicle protein [Serratia marcescens]
MSDKKEIQEVYSHTQRDSNLTYLVTTVNRLDFEMGITLFVKGSVITGQLISGLKYHRYIENSLASAGVVGEALSGYFKQTAENLYAPTKNENDEYNDIPCNFIHLNNVSIQNGNGGFNKINNAYLRISLDEIDGHIIGSAS